MQRQVINTGLALATTAAIFLAGCQGADYEEQDDDVDAEEAALGVSRLFVDLTPDEHGGSATASRTHIDLHSTNPFFHDFGTNDRTCGTCHQEAFGWTITPEFARSRHFNDPLFAFDGSDCLAPGVRNHNPYVHSKQMLSKALVRIDLGIPAGADFTMTSAVDHLACPTPLSPADLRMYRRPLPAANTIFQSTVMWDGRENVNPPNDTIDLILADLRHQSNSATRGHAQATMDLSAANQDSIVKFETGLFNAQSRIGWLNLRAHGGHGGPEYLYRHVLPSYHIGINDVFSPGFTSTIFTIYQAWEPGASPGAPSPLAASIGRGEAVFNNKTFPIDNVRGINSADPDDHDPVSGTFTGSCGTCHDTPNIGNHSVTLPIDIGITAANPVGGLDIAALPVYTFTQIGTGKTIKLTDPGRGLISGKFKDLGKTKGPTLRSLASRAPYFHNGSARDLSAIVDFYEARFNVGFTDQERKDLINFLNAL